jgi:hypothetical protein
MRRRFVQGVNQEIEDAEELVRGYNDRLGVGGSV